jgi:multicomponent Na+:H+ antiporter subunit B
MKTGDSFILRAVATFLFFLINLFAIYLLLRGHNEPGGGFIAGLVTASALVLHGLAFGTAYTRDRLGALLRPAPWVGLAVAVAAGLAAVAAGVPFLTHFHGYVHLAGTAYHVSTTLLFDIGVYMVVVGTTAALMAVFAEGAE